MFNVKEMCEKYQAGLIKETTEKYTRFSAFAFIPRNNLDSDLHSLMQRCLKSHHEQLAAGVDLPSIESAYDNLLTANGVPKDTMTISNSGFSREKLLDLFYDYNPENIYDLSDRIEKYKAR